MRAPAPTVAGRWKRRSFASALLRATILVVPVAASAAAGVAVARALPRPHGLLAVAWWVAVFATSSAALLAIDRAARRALPLAALLRLTLVFPDRAPSRVSVALKSRSLRSLRAWARSVTARDDTAQCSGERATAVLALAAALNAHDRRTRGHSERVRVLSLLVAEELKLSEEDKVRLGWSALLHDIGKLTVPVEILNKSSEPDAHEWEILRRHPTDGARLAEPLHEWLGGWIDAIEDHHEKFDGSGYPHGLAGEAIPLAARIVSITDSFETMTAVRSYKTSMTPAAARRELARCAGSHFDPGLVRAFLNISLGRLTWKLGPVAWLAALPFMGHLPRAGAIARAPVSAPSGALAGTAAVAVSVVLAVGAPVSGPAEVTDLNGDGGGAGRSVHVDDTVEVGRIPAARHETGDTPGATTPPAVTDPAPATHGPEPAIQGPAPAGDGALVDPPAAAAPGGGGGGSPEGPPPPPSFPPVPPTLGTPGDAGGEKPCPPGQELRDWAEHPHGGPPGLAQRCG